MTMHHAASISCLLTVVLTTAAPAQQPSPAAMDSLLGHLVGRWEMTGTVRGRPATYTLDAERVLQGRFVELHMTDTGSPPAYEARAFLGVDSAKAQYVVHWLDNFGAAYSIPHATGTSTGETLTFLFQYADGPFRDTFAWNPAALTWHFLLESGDSTGGWSAFAEYEVRRR